MSAATVQALSAQEQAIESGKKVVHGTVTDRVLIRRTGRRTVFPA